MSAWWCVRHGWTAGACVRSCDRRLIGPFTALALVGKQASAKDGTDG